MNLSDGKPIICIRNLSHRFSNGVYGLRDIHLDIQPGSFTLIAGENGSGKTTLLMHLNGLIRAQQGSVVLEGKRVEADPVRARQLVGMVFQNADSQIVGETVCEDVAFGPENLGLDDAEVQRRVSEALDIVGLAHRKEQRAYLLSGGEKRRLAIAGILAMHPRVLVFDEPFANLDYKGTCQVVEKIVALHRKGHTVLLTTHDLEKIVAHADRLILLSEGRVVRDGPPGEILPDSERFGVRQPCASRMGWEIPSWVS
jgi:biotin transport system ATP-binding protein